MRDPDAPRFRLLATENSLDWKRPGVADGE